MSKYPTDERGLIVWHRPSDVVCGTCQFFLPGRPIPVSSVTGEHYGMSVAQGGCRRFAGPPPQVNVDHWCGEWAANRRVREMLAGDL